MDFFLFFVFIKPEKCRIMNIVFRRGHVKNTKNKKTATATPLRHPPVRESSIRTSPRVVNKIIKEVASFRPIAGARLGFPPSPLPPEETPAIACPLTGFRHKVFARGSFASITHVSVTDFYTFLLY